MARALQSHADGRSGRLGFRQASGKPVASQWQASAFAMLV